MENPFKVKGLAVESAFYDRTAEMEALVSRMKGGQHTLLLAPRRFGKSSLLNQAARRCRENRDALVATVDLFTCTSVAEMANAIAKAVVEAQEGGVSKIMASLRRGIPKLAPSISFNAMGEPEFSLRLEPVAQTLDKTAALLEWFDSSPPGRRKVLIIDEFQEIIGFEDKKGSGQIERHLRSVMQRLTNTTLIFSGSSPSLLKEMFYDRRRAFYQSVLKMELGMTPLSESREFLLSKLKLPDADRRATQDLGMLCGLLSEVSQGHPYYTRLLGYFAWEWLRDPACPADPALLVHGVVERVFREERATFENAITLLTPQQRQVFRAICREPFAQVTSRDFISGHDLPAHTSVAKAVTKLDVLGFVLRSDAPRGWYAADPLLGRWWAQRG